MTLRSVFFGLLFAGLLAPAAAPASELPTENGATVIHLDQHNGYFAAENTLGGLEPGEYKFVVTNKAGKVVGFQVQHMTSHETLTKFPLDPGETKSATVRIGEAGVRYRCPINPTPWYNLDNIQSG
ncbi:hypothetical protein [Thiohalorhabdus sp.]|uniref:hypothetical protein n=1 Tax=Thiohalorhabdus sp. TaxID=3094134 RepID=UPI002FC34861